MLKDQQAWSLLVEGFVNNNTKKCWEMMNIFFYQSVGHYMVHDLHFDKKMCISGSNNCSVPFGAMTFLGGTLLRKFTKFCFPPFPLQMLLRDGMLEL